MESKNKLIIQAQERPDLQNTGHLIEYEKTLTLEICVDASPMINDKGAYFMYKKNIDIAITSIVHLAGIEEKSNQIQSIVNQMFEDFKNESFEDIVMALKEVRVGNYGVLYGRLDYMFLKKCIIDHLDKKYQLKESMLHSYKSGDNTRKIKKVESAYSRFKADYLTKKINQ